MAGPRAGPLVILPPRMPTVCELLILKRGGREDDLEREAAVARAWPTDGPVGRGLPGTTVAWWRYSGGTTLTISDCEVPSEPAGVDVTAGARRDMASAAGRLDASSQRRSPDRLLPLRCRFESRHARAPNHSATAVITVMHHWAIGRCTVTRWCPRWTAVPNQAVTTVGKRPAKRAAEPNGRPS